MKVIDFVNKIKDEKIQPLEDKWKERHNVKYDSMNEEIGQKIISKVVPKYHLQPLFEIPELEVKLSSVGLTLRYASLHCSVSYESWRDHDNPNNEFKPNLVSVDYSLKGYSWRNSKALESEDLTESFEKYKQYLSAGFTITDVLLKIDFTSLVKDLWLIGNEIRSKYSDMYETELSDLRSEISKVVTEQTEMIYNSIKPGDDLSHVVARRSVNIRQGYSKLSLSSTPIFDQITSRDGFRVIQTYDTPGTTQFNKKETFSPTDVKSQIKYALSRTS